MRSHSTRALSQAAATNGRWSVSSLLRPCGAAKVDEARLSRLAGVAASPSLSEDVRRMVLFTQHVRDAVPREQAVEALLRDELLDSDSSPAPSLSSSHSPPGLIESGTGREEKEMLDGKALFGNAAVSFEGYFVAPKMV